MSGGKQNKESMSDWLDKELEQNSELYEALEGEPGNSDISREDFGY
jgi:hypothetical protein